MKGSRTPWDYVSGLGVGLWNRSGPWNSYSGFVSDGNRRERAWCVARKRTGKANFNEEAWRFQVDKVVSSGKSQCFCENLCVCVGEALCFRSPQLEDLREQ